MRVDAEQRRELVGRGDAVPFGVRAREDVVLDLLGDLHEQRHVAPRIDVHDSSVLSLLVSYSSN